MSYTYPRSLYHHDVQCVLVDFKNIKMLETFRFSLLEYAYILFNVSNMPHQILSFYHDLCYVGAKGARPWQNATPGKNVTNQESRTKLLISTLGLTILLWPVWG